MTSSNPLISVIVPSFRHAHLIGRTLQSVLDQTYTKWELIVVDNHSPDHTDLVVEAFSDPRIKLLKIHNNGVIAASRNMGVRNSNGEWIAFVDSDDWWTSNKLQECVAHMTEETDLIYHNLEIVKEEKSFIRLEQIKSWQLNKPALIDLLVNGNPIANSSVVVRKDVLVEIGGLNESAELIGVEDYYAWLKIAENNRCFVYLPMRLGYYYINKQGISNKDMSHPARNSVAEYLHLLTDKQKEKMESRFQYAKGSAFFKDKKYASAQPYLFFALIHGKCMIKFKSLVMLLISFQIFLYKNKAS